MAKKKPDPKKTESIARRIIAYYVDSAEDKDADFLILYLGGGKIPAEAVKVLRPILESLTDESAEFGSSLAQADFAALEQLREEVETLYEKKAATRRDLKKAINSPQWAKAERAHAAQFGCELLPADERMLDLLAQEVAVSDFPAAEVISTFHSGSASVAEFGRRWYADCNDCDYEEEWDPAEGNQQKGNPRGEVLGMGQGFLVGYIILYLYAAKAPDGIIGFYKRQKLAQGKKVAKDVLRVYRQTAKGKS